MADVEAFSDQATLLKGASRTRTPETVSRSDPSTQAHSGLGNWAVKISDYERDDGSY